MPMLDEPKKENINEEVLKVDNLHTYLFTKKGVVKAVDGVSFSLKKGETLGIVGESGSGKSMTALSLLRLPPKPAGRIVEGKIIMEGEDILKLNEKQLRKIRGKKISMILQDPQTSLNPVFTIGDQLIEAIRKDRKSPKSKLLGLATKALKLVQIPSPAERISNFPHQLSGGMRQRVVGAIAFSCDPKIIIADEPTTSLDVTIQAQYLKMMKEIQERKGTSIIFITHDFGVVARMCHRVMVMYAGRIVEKGPVKSIFSFPSHPYTKALIKSLPKMEERVEKLIPIPGRSPSFLTLPKGCRFANRCLEKREYCEDDYPPSFAGLSGEKDHIAFCWRLKNDQRE